LKGGRLNAHDNIPALPEVPQTAQKSVNANPGPKIQAQIGGLADGGGSEGDKSVSNIKEKNNHTQYVRLSTMQHTLSIPASLSNPACILDSSPRAQIQRRSAPTPDPGKPQATDGAEGEQGGKKSGREGEGNTAYERKRGMYRGQEGGTGGKGPREQTYQCGKCDGGLVRRIWGCNEKRKWELAGEFTVGGSQSETSEGKRIG